MNRGVDIEIRRGQPSDSGELAQLMNVAGEGIPAYIWSLMSASADDVMEFGARRVERPEGAFSFTNTRVAVVSGQLAGMLLGYRLPDPCEIGSDSDCPDVVRPLVELEALAPGSWYINAVATSAAHRGKGIGTRLMELAESLAGHSGAAVLSLIVAEENAAAKSLYEKLGYETRARRAIIPFPGCPHGGDWILMTKPARRQA